MQHWFIFRAAFFFLIAIYKFDPKESNMKITESRLRQIINQEACRMLSEAKYGMHNMPGPGDFDPEEGDEENTDTAYLKCSMGRYGGVIVDEVGLSSSSDERQEIEDRLNRISSPEEIDEILDKLRLDGIMLADDSDAHGAKSYQEISVNDFYGEIRGS